MEAKALEAEGRISRSSTKEEALNNAILCTEIYMKAIKVASNESERARLKSKCMKVLARAEEIKGMSKWRIQSKNEDPLMSKNVSDTPVSIRTLSAREEAILLEGSKLHGLVFPPWTLPPSKNFFDLVDETLYEDSSEIGLSVSQQKVFSGWRRPSEVLQRRWLAGDLDKLASNPTMVAEKSIDLVQDVTADCSVVASLCAAVARIGDGFEKHLRSIVYPYDDGNGRPIVSNNGRYVFRFHFNGCFRRVIIDDRLPDSTTSHTLHVVDRRNPGLLWPALIEKAYLKVRGGYDFPGSNSSTDLWVLTGWIPEQTFLQSDEIQPLQLWNRLSKAYNFGDVIATVGTGRLSQREEDALGLAGEHDYAILAMKETGDQRLMLVKNPWCSGTVWKSTSSRIPGSHNFTTEDDTLHDSAMEGLTTSPGTFWITFDEVVQNFESLYLNWNPALFRYRQDHHFSWNIPQFSSRICFAHNPQYSITSITGGPLWILLSRHFSTEESLILRASQDLEPSPKSPLGFISLYIFQADGDRVHLSDDAFLRGPFVDSPQTLARLDAAPGMIYTVVIAQDSLPLPKYSFSLAAFSREPISMSLAAKPYHHIKTLSGIWTSRSAGGNASSPSYPANPQFSISLSSPADLIILLETHRPELAVHVNLVWANGERVTAVTARDIVGDSGEYRRGCALTKISNLPAGLFTIVCSTFEPGQCGNFNLRIESAQFCEIRPIAHEAAGKLSLRLPELVMSAGVHRMLAPVVASRMARLRVVASHKIVGSNSRSTQSQSKARSPLKISLERGQGPHKAVLAASGDGGFSDAAVGVRTPDIDVSPQNAGAGDVWLVVERLAGAEVMNEIEVDVLSDVRVAVGAWGTGSG